MRTIRPKYHRIGQKWILKDLAMDLAVQRKYLAIILYSVRDPRKDPWANRDIIVHLRNSVTLRILGLCW